MIIEIAVEVYADKDRASELLQIDLERMLNRRGFAFVAKPQQENVSLEEIEKRYLGRSSEPSINRINQLEAQIQDLRAGLETLRLSHNNLALKGVR